MVIVQDDTMKSDSLINKFFSPQEVVLFGSVSEGKVGYQLLQSIYEGGFPGRVVCINRQAKGAFNYPAFRSVKDVPHPIDLAVVAVPSQVVAEVLRECGDKGVSGAIVISSGFSEIGNVDAERDLTAVSLEKGIRIIGPNCAGLISTSTGFFPCLEVHPKRGKIAFLSQSGALGGAVLGAASERGLGFSKFISLGNRVDVGEGEILEYLAEDRDTEVVCLYIEGFRGDGRRFLRVAKEVCRKKPVIVIKAGRTNVGRRAVQSHTGSMTGEDRIYDTAFKQAGLIRVKSIDDMLDLAHGFMSLPEIKGPKVAIVTNSGGPGVLTADYCEELSFQVKEPPQEIVESLSKGLAKIASTKNPFDLTLHKEYEDYRLTIESVLDAYDSVIAINVATPHVHSEQIAQGIIDGSRRYRKPVVTTFMPESLVKKAVGLLVDKGIPHFPSWERCAAVLEGMLRYHRFKGQEDPVAAGGVTHVGGRGQKLMLEPDAMHLLQNSGFPVPNFRVATNAEEAVNAAAEIGYPVVLKVVSQDIVHKSDAHGVRLNIPNPKEVEEAFEAVKQMALGKDFRGAVIYPHIADGLEVIIGMFADEIFGPVVSFGMGGVFTEIISDSACRIGPITRNQAYEMIDEIRASRILRGTRGLAPRDLDALASLLVKISEFSLDHPEVKEVDLNPVFSYEKGACIADARIVLSANDAEETTMVASRS